MPCNCVTCLLGTIAPNATIVLSKYSRLAVFSNKVLELKVEETSYNSSDARVFVSVTFILHNGEIAKCVRWSRALIFAKLKRGNIYAS